MQSVANLLMKLRGAPYLPVELREDLIARTEAELAALRAEHALLQAEAAPDSAPAAAATPEAGSNELPESEPPPVPSATEPPAPSAPREPTVWAKLGPVFAENLLFTLAAFLLVAGAVYFVTTAWTTMTGAERRLVVVGGLDLLGAVLYGAARLVNRDGGLPDAERLLLLVTTFLVPVAAAPAGELFAESFGLGCLGAALVLIPGWFVARAAGRSEDPALARPLPPALVGFAVAILAAPLVGGAPVFAMFLVAVALVVVVRLGSVRVLPALGPSNAPAHKGGALLAFSTIVFAGAVTLAAARAGEPAGAVVAVPGIVLAGIGLAAVLLEVGLHRAERLAGGRSLFLLIGGIAAGIGGTVIAFGNGPGLLAAAFLGSAAAVVAGLRLPGGLALIPGLALTLIAYFMLPAPIRELATRLRDDAAAGLGYAPKRLPISFYGITFLPYVALSGFASVLLKRFARPAHARVLLWWTIAISAGLAALAILAGKDFRAPAAVLCAQGALLIILARPIRDHRLVITGVLGLFGGLYSALLHADAGSSVNVSVLSLAGLVAILAARVLGRREEGFGPVAGRAVLDATAAVAVGIVLVVTAGLMLDVPGEQASDPYLILAPSGSADIGAFLLLTLFLTSMAVVYDTAVGVMMTLPALLRAVTGAHAALEADAAAVPVLLASASALPLLLLAGLERIRRALPTRGLADSGWSPRAALPGLAVALPAFGLPAIFLCLRTGEWGAAHVVGLLLSAAIVVVAARWARQGWCAAAAAVLVALAGLALVGALGFDAFGSAGALGVALAISLVLGALHLMRRSSRHDEMFGLPLGLAVVPLSGVLFVRMLTRLIEPGYGVDTSAEGLVLAASALVLAISLWASLPRLRHCAGDAISDAAGVISGLAIALIPVGIFDQFDFPVEAYPLGLAAAAALAWLLSRGRAVQCVPAIIHLSIGLLLAWIVSSRRDLDAAPLLLSFGGIACGAWLSARRLPTFGGLLLLLSVLGALVFPLADEMLDLGYRWQPTVWLLFAAAALSAPGLEVLRVGRVPSRIVGLPILAVAALGFAFWDAMVAVKGAESSDALVAASIALLAAAFASAGRRRTVPAALVRTFSLLLAVAAFSPVNLLLYDTFGYVARPDIEVALVGIFAALNFPRPGPADGRHLPPDGAPGLAYPLAALALLLTAAELRHASTPLAAFAVSFVPLALLVRSRGAAHAAVHGYSLLLAALAFVLYVVPDTGKPAAEILPLIGATAAVLLALFAAVVSKLPTLLPDFAAAGRAYAHAVAASAVVVLLTVLANGLILRDSPADDIGIALSVFATGLTAFILGRAAFRGGRPWLLQGAVLCVLVLYGFLVWRTPVLDLLDGLHLHALAVIGFGLMFLSGVVRPELRGSLIADALLLPVPAVLASMPAIFGAPVLDGHEPGALFLSAGLYGLAAQRTMKPALGVLAAAVLNLAVFAVWRRAGYVDPAFYGVPPGMTLLLGAEVFRRGMAPGTRMGLVVVGAALLYGSVGVQVLRVEEPTHALVLFGLGLLTVFGGLWSRRNGYMIGGAVVVVLDVVAYLARHGFEESFLGAALLVMAGLTVLAVATMTAKRRRGRDDDGG